MTASWIRRDSNPQPLDSESWALPIDHGAFINVGTFCHASFLITLFVPTYSQIQHQSEITK